MHAAVRPYATAGVALLGAGVIAVSPLAPPMPDVSAVQRAVTSVNVQLSAAVNPLERWFQVLETTTANVGAIGQQVIDNPAPILAQIIANQLASATAFGNSLQTNLQTVTQIVESVPGVVQTAAGQLQAGDIAGAVATVNNSVVIPLVLAALQVGSDALVPLVNVVNNFAKAFATLPNAVFAVALPMTFPLLSAVNVIVQTTQDVVDGAVAGDAGAVINALVNAPANLVDGVLNGYGTVLGLLPAAGILTPYSPDFGFLASGPIASLIALRETIAEALGATPPTAAAVTSAVATVPTATKTVTLAVAPPEVVSSAPASGATKSPSVKSTTDDAAAAAAAADSTTSTQGGSSDSPAPTEGTNSGSDAGGTDSSSTGTSAESSSSPAASGVKGTHGAAKPGVKKSGSSAKAGKSASSGSQD